jgi:hypothetical protein
MRFSRSDCCFRACTACDDGVEWKLRRAVGARGLRKALYKSVHLSTRRKTLPRARRHGSIRSLSLMMLSSTSREISKLRLRNSEVGDDSAPSLPLRGLTISTPFFNHHHYICAASETLPHCKTAFELFIKVPTLLVCLNSSQFPLICPPLPRTTIP